MSGRHSREGSSQERSLWQKFRDHVTGGHFLVMLFSIAVYSEIFLFLLPGLAGADILGAVVGWALNRFVITWGANKIEKYLKGHENFSWILFLAFALATGGVLYFIPEALAGFLTSQPAFLFLAPIVFGIFAGGLAAGSINSLCAKICYGEDGSEYEPLADEVRNQDGAALQYATAAATAHNQAPVDRQVYRISPDAFRVLSENGGTPNIVRVSYQDGREGVRLSFEGFNEDADGFAALKKDSQSPPTVREFRQTSLSTLFTGLPDDAIVMCTSAGTDSSRERLPNRIDILPSTPTYKIMAAPASTAIPLPPPSVVSSPIHATQPASPTAPRTPTAPPSPTAPGMGMVPATADTAD